MTVKKRLNEIKSDYDFNSQKQCDNMRKFNIKDFGPIENAQMSVLPLTVLVGQNSSGKSYCTKLYHSILTAIDDVDSFSMGSFQTLSKNSPEMFDDFNARMMEYLKSKPNFFDDPFVCDAGEFDKLFYCGIIRHHVCLIEKSLKENFIGDLNMLNAGVSGKSFEIALDEIEFSNACGTLLSDGLLKITQNKIKLKNKLLFELKRAGDKMLIYLDYLALSNLFNDSQAFSAVFYLALASAYAERQKEKSLYIPASAQSTTDKFKSILFDELSGLKLTSNIEKDMLFSYLNNERVVKNETFFKIACQIERDVLNGEVKFKNNGVYEDLVFLDYTCGCEFDYGLVSSSVKQLTPLINYLKYELDVGDTLIIEEIENHLHPANQRSLVRHLVNLVNAGLNIILTTHSDYILEQFNNFIRLSNVSDDGLSDLGFEKRDILDVNDVAIYNFKRNPFEIVRFDINRTGFLDGAFQEVIEELYQESCAIINSKGV